MKKLVSLAVGLVLSLSLAFGQTEGLVSGVASIDGKPVSSIAVRLRNIDSGQLVGHATANASGGFSFSGLAPGSYVVEMVTPTGAILGTSGTITLTAAAMAATGVSVGASGAAIAAAGGTAAAAGAAAGAASGLSTTVIAVSTVAATLGTTAVVAASNDASPSR